MITDLHSKAVRILGSSVLLFHNKKYYGIGLLFPCVASGCPGTVEKSVAHAKYVECQLSTVFKQSFNISGC